MHANMCAECDGCPTQCRPRASGATCPPSRTRGVIRSIFRCNRTKVRRSARPRTCGPASCEQFCEILVPRGTFQRACLSPLSQRRPRSPQYLSNQDARGPSKGSDSSGHPRPGWSGVRRRTQLSRSCAPPPRDA